MITAQIQLFKLILKYQLKFKNFKNIENERYSRKIMLVCFSFWQLLDSIVIYGSKPLQNAWHKKINTTSKNRNLTKKKSCISFSIYLDDAKSVFGKLS